MPTAGALESGNDKPRQLAIVIADAGLLLWGALTVIAPQCPGACTTKFETFTSQS